MAKEFYTAWDQITLSPEADGRIRAALDAAMTGRTNVVPLHAGGAGKRRVRRTARVTVVAAAMACLLSVTALAVGIRRIVITERQSQATDTGTGQTETLTEVGFSGTDEAGPVRMGVWTVQDMPAEYALTDDFYTLGSASQTWQAPDGSRIDFRYTTGGEAYPIGMLLPGEEEVQRQAVTVNGREGTLYTFPGITAVFWTDEEQGVGFTLLGQAGAEDRDLVALAESVARTGEAPESSANTLAALAELGDWAVTDLPAGYSTYFDQGTPSAVNGGGYSYVRRFYADQAGHVLELRCETPVNDACEGYVANYRTGFEHPADAPEAVCTVRDLTVQGLPAGLIEYPDGRPLRLVWLAEDGSVAFLMSADGLTSEELLAAAESVACLARPTVPLSTARPDGQAAPEPAGAAVTPRPTQRPQAAP